MARVQIYRMYTGRSFICDKNVLENLIFKTRLTSAKIKLSAMLPGTCLDLHAEKSNAPLRCPLPFPSTLTTSLPFRNPLFSLSKPDQHKIYLHEVHLPKQDLSKNVSEMELLLILTLVKQQILIFKFCEFSELKKKTIREIYF